MARTFAAGSATALNATSSPVITYPFTLAIWARPTGANGSQALFTLKDSAAGDDRDEAVLARDTSTTGRFGLYLVDWYGVGGYAQPSAAYVLGQWHHVCGTFASTSSRAVYMDGGNKGTNATTLSAPGFDRVSVGHVPQTSHFYANADLAEASIWNVVLTDDEVAQLALGLSPLFVRPSALVFYAPLLGGTSPEIELIGRRELALVNAPAVAPHPRVIQPSLAAPAKRGVTYTITGTTRNPSGVIIPGATVRLFRTSDNVFIASTTSDGAGHYSFTVTNTTTTYYVVAYKAGSPDAYGTSINTLTGS